MFSLTDDSSPRTKIQHVKYDAQSNMVLAKKIRFEYTVKNDVESLTPVHRQLNLSCLACFKHKPNSTPALLQT
jgi:hypothetical protein